MAMPETAQNVAEDVRETARKVHPWLEITARIGYMSRGVIYGLVGILAFMAATGFGGTKTDEEGVIQAIARQPFGALMLYAIGVGLIGYSVWRLLMAVFNPEGRGAIKRIAYAFTGLVYVGVGISAFDAADGDRIRQNDAEKVSGWLAMPLGPALVMAAGALLIVIGIIQFVNAYKLHFKKILKLYEMSENDLKLAVASGRVGLTARGIVFVLIGLFLIDAGADANPKDAGGLDKALRVLAEAPMGPVMLGTVALGLIAYAVFMFVEARFRRIVPA